MTMKIAVLSGGVGGARFARALDAFGNRADRPIACSAIVNVGDDFTHLGLRVSPDLDSVAYHLADLGDRERGWGRAGDTGRAMAEMRRVLPEASWFELGDLDIAHNLMRTHLLATGATLSAATRTLNERYGVECEVLPASDDPSPTLVALGPDGSDTVAFQEWWVRDRAEPAPRSFEFPGAASARPAPGVLEALRAADLIVIAPSNPVVSISPILAIPGIRDAVTASAAPVIGLSPVIGGKPVRGWLERCLAAIGVECSAPAISELYGDRRSGGLLDGWLADPVDAGLDTSFTGEVRHVPLRFHLDERDDRVVEALLDLADELTEGSATTSTGAATGLKSGLSV